MSCLTATRITTGSTSNGREQNSGAGVLLLSADAGAVELDDFRNPRLVEKAGREGFRENRAYRQLRDIVREFFRQVALDIFVDVKAITRDLRGGERIKTDELVRVCSENKPHASTVEASPSNSMRCSSAWTKGAGATRRRS